MWANRKDVPGMVQSCVRVPLRKLQVRKLRALPLAGATGASAPAQPASCRRAVRGLLATYCGGTDPRRPREAACHPLGREHVHGMVQTRL